MKSLLIASSLAMSVGAAMAQPPSYPPPQPSPMPPPVAAPRDVAFPGQIRLHVDATDLARRIYRVHETVPAPGAGPMTLLFPQWLPGAHSPDGPLDQFAGLEITAGGQRLYWTRDPVDVFAFHIDVPQGAAAVELSYQFLTPTSPQVGRIMVTPVMLNLEWNTVALYPAGYFSRDITYVPSVTLPAGWDFGVALDGASRSGDTVSFAPVTLNTLVDSPLIAGRNFRRIPLSDSPVPVNLDVVADRPEDLAVKPEQIATYRNLVAQAYRLYGSHHYDHYDFLLWLSDEMGGEGLEHHRSSEDGVGHDYFTDGANSVAQRDLLSHEYTHSWNGKFRRPADLWTPNFNVPMRDSLLWVYEGQTQYWGYNLAARAGLWTKQEALDAYAGVAATFGARIGAEWKPLQDTTNDPIIADRRPISWRSWQRSEDYYSQGQLIWLDADTLIREKTHNKKSLDDFAHGFFGVRDGSFVTDTYTFEDVAAALNAVYPYDWTTFLRERLDAYGTGARLDGITRGGYRLVFTETPTDFFKSNETKRKITDLSFSVGLVLDKDGKVTDVHWEGPAYQAGVVVGDQVTGVNGRAFDAGELKEAVTAAKTGGPISLLLKSGDHVRTVEVAWKGGLQYPHLQRITGAPDYLGDILKAKD